MAKKIELKKEEFLNIKNLYLKKKLTTKQISKKTAFSYTFITKILKQHNIYVNTKYIDKTSLKKGDLKKEISRIKDEFLKKEIIFNQNIKNDYPKNLVAICKKTKKEFKDYKNSSGILTLHLKKIYPNLEHPSNFKKREIKIKTKKYWHEIFFDIIEKEKEKTKKCKYCNWETKDIENKSGAYLIHLNKVHNLSIDEHLKNVPTDKKYFKNQITIKKNKKNRENELKNNFEDYIICKICNKKLKSLSNTHLKKHNLTLFEYSELFPEEQLHSNRFIEKTTKNLKKANLIAQRKFTSKAEENIVSFLENFNLKIEKNNRSILGGKEIDIVNHNVKKAIEYNGCKFHTELFGKKDKNYHLEKTKILLQKKYDLIHIFEDEWENKTEIVKSRIMSFFNIKDNFIKIHGRKCKTKEVNNKIKNDFLNKNHIQGSDNSRIAIGAFYENKIVAIMTFDNKRSMVDKNNKKTFFELKRFCVSLNHNIPGIADKLLKHFIKQYSPEKIITFADRRWVPNPDKNLYVSLGFVLSNILDPDYSYYKSSGPKEEKIKRYHKFSFGKSSIKKKYPSVYDDSKTEWEMMQELGFDRIWDCGKFKYELQL